MRGFFMSKHPLFIGEGGVFLTITQAKQVNKLFEAKGCLNKKL
jgi:hypothetical protein